MKSLFTITLSILSIGAFAQNFVYSGVQHREDTIITTNYQGLDIYFTTPQPQAITFEWETITNTFLPDWSYSVCDQGGCYVGLPGSGSMSPISLSQAQGGMEGFFKINLTVGQHYGEGVIEIYVYDSQDYNNGDTVSWHVWNLEGTGIMELSNTDIEIYPNPASSELNLSWNEANSPNQIRILNTVGSEIKTLSNLNSKIQLDVSDLPKGMYFASFEYGGEARITKRILVQ